jgi:pimeloyl-ACP methyl ester carboxylesterase
MEAFYFGPSDRSLFAVYHPATGAPARVLTVVCPPLFSEYMRTHLTLRKLAIALAEAGQDVVRFDYRGTGDSSGDLADVTVADWLDDIAHALDEARDLCESDFVQLLGIRAGALLACKAAGASRDVRRLVLWDPVPDGASYLDALRRVQRGILWRNPYVRRSERRAARTEYAGHRLAARMVGEFRRLDRDVYESVPKEKLHVVRTSPDTFGAAGVTTETIDCVCDWEIDVEQTILPQPVLERLIACLLHH